MNASRVEYHQGAIADVKGAVAWYRRRNLRVAYDFIEELRRATEIIREAPERWPTGQNNTRRFLLWRFPFAIIYSEHQSVVTIWAVANVVEVRNIGRIASNEFLRSVPLWQFGPDRAVPIESL